MDPQKQSSVYFMLQSNLFYVQNNYCRAANGMYANG